jgi:hypothetical protein
MLDRIKTWAKAQFAAAQEFTFNYTVAHWAYIALFVLGFALGLTAAW